METASDELITEAEKERVRKVLEQLCQDASVEISGSEARLTARAVYHDAVTAAAKQVAETIAEESVPIAREIVTAMLKDSSQHPFIQESVTEACRPIARHGALSAIRRWSEEKAMPKAEEAAHQIILEHMKNLNGSQPFHHSTVIAGLRVVLQNQLTENPQISADDREKVVDNYLAEEGKKAASEALMKGVTADMRRRAQAAAEQAVELVAAQATDEVAREEALNAARVVASDTAKAEISRLILAEAQRRAAKMARERMQEESHKIEEDKRAEYCQAEAKKVAEEAVKTVTEEIADPQKADLDLEKAHELALSAANAVAREFSGAYNLTSEEEGSAISKQTIVFLVAQIFLGGFIVWFFLLGGYEVCEPVMKAILPSSVYKAIYQAVPGRTDKAGTGTDIDDLLEDPDTGAGTGIEPIPGGTGNPDLDDVKSAPASSTGAGSPVKDGGTATGPAGKAAGSANDKNASPAVESGTGRAAGAGTKAGSPDKSSAGTGDDSLMQRIDGEPPTSK